jgi:magnesium-transporting ATPase (P-type)
MGSTVTRGEVEGTVVVCARAMVVSSAVFVAVLCNYSFVALCLRALPIFSHVTLQNTGMNTFFGKTATMIQAVDDSLGNLQKILLKIMVVLVVLSLTLCTIAFIYLMVAKDESFKEVCLRLRDTLKPAFPFFHVQIQQALHCAVSRYHPLHVIYIFI